MQTLKGRTCIFAGATGGDGVDTVKALCSAGMNVVMVTHNAAHAEKLISEIRELKLVGDCIYRTGDGTHAPEESSFVYDEIVEKYGSVDVIISNTGADGRIDDIETLSSDELMRSVNHLLIGSFGMLKTAIPYLKKSSAPRVIFMTTSEGIRGGTYESFSNAVAKGSVKSLTVNAAARLAKYGITVNCIAKGAISRIEGVHEGSPNPADRLSVIPMGRLGTPKDLADVICFIASEESSYITGQVFELNGGLNLGI